MCPGAENNWSRGRGRPDVEALFALGHGACHRKTGRGGGGILAREKSITNVAMRRE